MSKLNTVLSLVAVGVVAFVVGYIVGGSTGPKQEPGAVIPEEAATLPTVAKGLEHCFARGAQAAKVSIVEFSDFQ
jgi:hypothetical protein